MLVIVATRKGLREFLADSSNLKKEREAKKMWQGEKNWEFFFCGEGFGFRRCLEENICEFH